jgi:phosphate-selective porin OprO/OprP
MTSLLPRHRGLSAGLAALIAATPGTSCAQGLVRPSVEAPSPATNTAASTTPTTAPSSLALEALLQRIQDLERREAERARTATNDPNASLVQTLQQRIVDLESKIQSLERSVVVPELVATPDPAPTNAELDQQIRIVDRKRELAEEEAAARAKEMPQLSIGSTGFVMRSADTNFVLRIRGLIQADSRTFFDDNSLDDDNSGFLLRRARVGLEGTVFGDFDYQFNAELGDGGLGASNLQVLDANIAYRLQPNLRFRVGKFKGPVGYEQYLPVTGLLFNERSLATDLAPVRDSGVQVEGEAFDGVLGYAAGVFNTVGDRRNPSPSTISDDLQYGGRFQLQPFKHSDNRWFKGLAFGAGGSYSQISSNVVGLPNPIGGTIPGYATPTLQQFFAYNSPAGTVVADGVLWRFNPHLQYVKGPFGVLGEYILNGQDVLNATTLRSAHLNHSAWQASAQWVLTGEDASFGNLTPLRPLRPLDGGWGAWQLVARLSRFDVDSQAFEGFSNPATSANSALSWSVGINWWLTRNARILTSFTHTSFDDGGTVNAIDPTTQFPPATVTHQDEQALMTRFQLSY